MNPYIYIIKLFHLTSFERKLLFWGLIYYCFISIIIKLFPHKILKILSSKENGSVEYITKKSVADLLVKRTIKRISIAIPWNSSCLIKAALFKFLVHKVGLKCSISIKATIGPNAKLMAHAEVINDSGIIYLENTLFKGRALLIV